MNKTLVLLAVLLVSPFSLATVNVSFDSKVPTLQSDFLAGATAQWLGTLTKSPYFSNTYSFFITTANPAYLPVPPVVPSTAPIVFGSTGTYVVKIGDNIQTVYQSTSTFSDIYAYGFGDGQAYERYVDLSLLGYNMVKCSSATTPFPLVSYDSSNCMGLVSAASATLAGFYGKCTTDQTVFGVASGALSIPGCQAVASTMQKAVSNMAAFCVNPSTFGFRSSSAENCTTPMADAYSHIYNQYFSTPTVVPPMGP